MSSEAIAWMKKLRLGSPVGKAIGFVLADYADRQGKTFAGQKTIAEECECSERAVRKWLEIFEGKLTLKGERLAEGEIPKPGDKIIKIIDREERWRKGGSRSSDMITLLLSIPAPGAGIKPAPDSASNRHPVPGVPAPGAAHINLSPKSLPSASAREDDPTAILADVLSADVAEDLVAHFAGLGKPLTGHTARGKAEQLGRCPDPDAAAHHMIEAGWSNVDIAWLPLPQSKPTAPDGEVRETVTLDPRTEPDLMLECESTLGRHQLPDQPRAYSARLVDRARERIIARRSAAA